MAQIIFRCPNTGLNVQHWLADDPKPDASAYELVDCAACWRPHFINKSTGELLSHRSTILQRTSSENKA